MISHRDGKKIVAMTTNGHPSNISSQRDGLSVKDDESAGNGKKQNDSRRGLLSKVKRLSARSLNCFHQSDSDEDSCTTLDVSSNSSKGMESTVEGKRLDKNSRHCRTQSLTTTDDLLLSNNSNRGRHDVLAGLFPIVADTVRTPLQQEWKDVSVRRHQMCSTDDNEIWRNFFSRNERNGPRSANDDQPLSNKAHHRNSMVLEGLEESKGDEQAMEGQCLTVADIGDVATDNLTQSISLTVASNFESHSRLSSETAPDAVPCSVNTPAVTIPCKGCLRTRDESTYFRRQSWSHPHDVRPGKSCLKHGTGSGTDFRRQSWPSGRGALFVSFDKVMFREFERVIGDNPSVSAGPPIALGWSYARDDHEMNVEDYESHRPPRRKKQEFAMPPNIREEMLVEEWGFSPSDIRRAISDSKEIKLNREHSTNQGRYAEKVEELVETTMRKWHHRKIAARVKRKERRGSA